MKKFIKLYSVNLSLMLNYDEEDIIDGFKWSADLKETLAKYENISVKDFNTKDCLKWALRGFKTYNKYILVVEMPKSLYDYCFGNGSKGQGQNYLSDFVFEKSVKWNFENLKDEVFELNGFSKSLRIENVRPYKSLQNG